MENISIAEAVLVITSLLTAASPLLLGLFESRNKERRGAVDDALNLTVVMKSVRETYDGIIDDLAEANERIKADFNAQIDEIKRNYSEREKQLLADLESMEIRIKRNQERVDAVLQNEMEKSRTLEIRLEAVTLENEQLLSRLKTQGERIASQDELIAELQAENAELRETIRVIRNDVTGLKLKTGDLKWPTKRGNDDKLPPSSKTT